MFKFETLTLDLVEKYGVSRYMAKIKMYIGSSVKVDLERFLLHINEKEYYSSYPEFGFMFIVNTNLYWGTKWLVVGTNQSEVQLFVPVDEKRSQSELDQLQLFLREIYPDSENTKIFIRERGHSFDVRKQKKNSFMVDYTATSVIFAVLAMPTLFMMQLCFYTVCKIFFIFIK